MTDTTTEPRPRRRVVAYLSLFTSVIGITVYGARLTPFGYAVPALSPVLQCAVTVLLLAGVVLGIVALVLYARAKGSREGRWAAVVGLILGCVPAALQVLFFAYLLVMLQVWAASSHH